MLLDDITIKPIGKIHSKLSHRYETPRQGVLAGKEISVIELIPKNNFQQALKFLDGFERIWVLYQFHLNNNWKPLVNPPRHIRKKVGVFATRAPYRPNHIGMSCVKLEKIEGLKIFISGSDILDGSPVIDIKPYLPYSDSFPDAETGWVVNDIENIYKVEFKTKAKKQCVWLNENAEINLESFTRLQLEFNPTDATRKRISILNTNDDTRFVLAYRTWRINYKVDKKKVIVLSISSGYSNVEMKNILNDKYGDKEIHKMFAKNFRDRKN
ncbi:MAG: tRNA (N6-threonylcarbamoyladenosine(37)-N6)-methyltransferase TrmO [Ignavibacteriales bacterium]|nr:tRNA (N6-threonylcarbamoyladenosine(37)-N6)-methyltransferase TrmO [Ignavibacteriales bacterium]